MTSIFRQAFDSDSVPQKNLALRKAHDMLTSITPYDHWNVWDKHKPQTGDKIVVICDDMTTTFTGLVTECNGMIRVMGSEDGEVVPICMTKRSMWTHLPKDYPLLFMELTID